MTKVMGILNVTPDSFSDGGLWLDAGMAIDRADEMLREGADIIDVGGESTRPGAVEVDEKEELRRIIPVVTELVKRCVVSIDTVKPGVALAATDAGASIINDVSGSLWSVAATQGVSWIAMHMQGTPRSMQLAPSYGNVVEEIYSFLAERVRRAQDAGVHDIWVDPGIGFGKTVDQNLSLLNHLGVFRRLGAPLVIGISRKSFIGRILEIEDPRQRLVGSIAATALAVAEGADVVRAHDVEATIQTIRIAEAIRVAKLLMSIFPLNPSEATDVPGYRLAEDRLTMRNLTRPALETSVGLEWLAGRGVAPRKPGAQRIAELLGRIGDPHRGLSGALVAGTNGKGSTCAVAVAGLTEIGLRVGSMPSPHLQSYYERIRINGVPISPDDFRIAVTQVRPAVEAMEAAGREPTQFEILTAITALHFARAEIDVVVAEVGLGGRLDATNVLPLNVKAITSIGLDHAEYLGTTIESVAWNKAGIIRENDTVLLSLLPDNARRIICEEIEQSSGCRLLELGNAFSARYMPDRKLAEVKDQFGKTLRIHHALWGEHQLYNLALGIAVAQEVAVTKLGRFIEESAWRSCLSQIRWPGRLELVKTETHSLAWPGSFLLDGAHNVQAFDAVIPVLIDQLDPHGIVILGFMKDKNVAEMVTRLPRSWRLIATSTGEPRAFTPSELAGVLRGAGFPQVLATDTPADAINAAARSNRSAETVAALGSLHLIGAIRTVLGLPVE